MRRYDVTYRTIAWKNMRTICYAEDLDDLMQKLSEIHHGSDITIIQCGWTIDPPEENPLPF